jgi:urease accessory protein
VDRLTLSGEALEAAEVGARDDRASLAGAIGGGRLERGLVARYRGTFSRDARYCFCRIWVHRRAAGGLPPPTLRVWPLHEEPPAPLSR